MYLVVSIRLHYVSKCICGVATMTKSGMLRFKECVILYCTRGEFQLSACQQVLIYTMVHIPCKP